MSTVKSYVPLGAALSTKSKALSAGSSTETSFPGLPAHLHGEASNLLGGELVAGLLLILLFAGALLIPFERLMPQEQSGTKSSPSTSTGSLPKKRTGGTGRGQYDEE